MWWLDALVVLLGLVALVQGVAWMGGGQTTGSRRRAQGSALAPLGLLLMWVAALHWMVPGFFGG